MRHELLNDGISLTGIRIGQELLFHRLRTLAMPKRKPSLREALYAALQWMPSSST